MQKQSSHETTFDTIEIILHTFIQYTFDTLRRLPLRGLFASRRDGREQSFPISDKDRTKM